jgi:hypothetical protein|tara:strand:+ start:11360 stop:11719 length:360 start_codon:yes stop_codon:yes gene_type:complete
MSADNYDDLREHIGHKIVCVCYGKDGERPDNVAIECEDCGIVIIDHDKTPYPPPDPLQIALRAYYNRYNEVISFIKQGDNWGTKCDCDNDENPPEPFYVDEAEDMVIKYCTRCGGHIEY